MAWFGSGTHPPLRNSLGPKGGDIQPAGVEHQVVPAMREAELLHERIEPTGILGPLNSESLVNLNQDLAFLTMVELKWNVSFNHKHRPVVLRVPATLKPREITGIFGITLQLGQTPQTIMSAPHHS